MLLPPPTHRAHIASKAELVADHLQSFTVEQDGPNITCHALLEKTANVNSLKVGNKN